jgi:hypothetical protein
MSKLQEDAKNVGLRINAVKTRELRINSSVEAKLTLKGTDLEQGNSFLFLGSIVTKTGGAEEDVKRRIRQAKGTFIQSHPVWKKENIARRTRLRLFKSKVKSASSYGCE